MASSRKVKALSEHRTRDEAIAAWQKAAETIARNGKAGQFSVKMEPTGDQYIPWAVYLYERSH